MNEETRDLPPLILVHGALHGGWCWREVARPLRRSGFEVYTPTLTGLGDRRHLLAAATDIEVFIRDIALLLAAEELVDAVLVGHSFGARVVLGVADRMPHAVRRLILLDGGLPENGRSRLDTMPAEAREARIKAAMDHDGGISVPPPAPSRFGVEDLGVAAWMHRQLTPQPLAVEASPIHLQHPLGAGRPVTYVRCVDPAFVGTDESAAIARATPGWTYKELSGGHNALMTQPAGVAQMIVAEAGTRLPS